MQICETDKGISTSGLQAHITQDPTLGGTKCGTIAGRLYGLLALHKPSFRCELHYFDEVGYQIDNDVSIKVNKVI